MFACTIGFVKQMLTHLRDIITHPDISALGLMWREGAGPLEDGGALVNSGGASDLSRNTSTARTEGGQQHGLGEADGPNGSGSGAVAWPACKETCHSLSQIRTRTPAISVVVFLCSVSSLQ